MTSLGVTLLFYLILSGCPVIQETVAVEFTWLSGDWRGCNPDAECGSSDGQQTRIVSCVDRNHRQVDDVKCAVSSRPQDRRTCFRVCEHHRQRYRWSIGPWGPCHPRRGASYCQDSFGVQYRNVTCVPRCPASSFVSVSVSEACEAFERAPASVRQCRLACIEDCVTSDFGLWSTCDSCSLKNRTRHRAVLSGPANGGKACAGLVDTQACPSAVSSGGQCSGRTASSLEGVFRYRLGKWMDCLPLKDGEMRRLQKHIPILGSRWRTVECVDPHGNVVDMTDDRCLRLPKKPTTTQLCLLDGGVCSSSSAGRRDQVDSRPNEWTNYSRSLYSFVANDRNSIEAETFLLLQETHRRVLGSTSAKGCPGSTHTEAAAAAVDSADNRCRSFKWITGSWTECLPQFKCGQGVQNRTVLCVRTAVADDRCLTDPPLHTRRCFIPCPMDCVMSSWSAWSDCLPEKCRLERVKQKDGYRLRLRGIIQEGLHGGRDCPHLHALQPCEFPACYSWKIVTSGQCVVRQTGMMCGEGIRNRTAECINLQGEKVAGRFCPDPRPGLSDGCVAPCLNDCLLSEWNEWSPCSQTCSLARTGGYKTRFRDILATAGPGGADCPPLRLVIEKERCGDLPCLTYHWQTKDWGDCRMNTATKCGNGIQYREVYCVESSGEKVASKRCLSEYAPTASRNCSVACPVDCVVSVFTDWSPCPVTCLTEKMNVFPEQFRHRFVLEYPFHGGVQCPHLTEFQPCTSLPRCTSYQWHLSDWSPCIHANPSDRCGYGYRTRVVRCLDSNEDQATNNRCLSGGGIRPVVAQPCHVTCGQEPCVFSDWSTWSQCSERCHGNRRRWRTMEGLSGRIPECFQRGTYPIEETGPCNDCPEYATKLIGLWSDCILDALDNSVALSPDNPIGQMRSTSTYCGIGRRFHSLVCTDPSGSRNVSALTCNAFDNMEEMCFIPCRRDCQLSVWTTWSSCETGQRCGNGERRRSRYLIDTSLDGGRDCPPLVDGEEYQTLPCHVSCEEYRWLAGDWSICTTLNGLSNVQCGAEIQSRSVKCVRVSEDGDATEISDRLCDKKTRPHDTNDCHIPCPGQCVVSAWSEWTKCPEQCQGHTRRHRSRSIIRHPDPNSGFLCPTLEEIEKCDLEPRCHTYTVRWSDWGPCIAHQNLTCGSGLRQRFSECLRSDGGVVSKEFCQQHSSDLELAGVEPCTDPCPVDCVVSEWSLWSSCSETCGLGLQTRSRTVLVKPEHRGRHCPEPIIQKRYCPYQECFRWELTDWGRCDIEDDSCGYGIHNRKLKCMRLDDLEVDLELCDPRLLTMFKLTGECFVPCPGDCEVSAWSSWGPCHRPCVPGDQANNDHVGVQSRSRVVLMSERPGRHQCPTNLLETRSCSSGHCPQYRWHAGIWIGNRRQVWCQDVSGGKVFGACRESEKPTAVKSCHPPCIIPYSECRDFDLCICSRGYEPVYRGGLLIACQLSSSSSSSSSGVDRIQANIQESSNNLALYHQYDMSADVWMYSIMVSGAVFVILLIIAIYVICWRSRQQRSVAQPLATDAELRPNDDRNGKHAVSQAYKDGLNASFAAEKQPSPKEYFEQTDLCKNYNFLHQSFPEHQPQQQLQLQQTQQQHPQRMSSSFITNYTKCSSKNDFYPLS